jgi:hypothetical protein
MPFRRPIGSDCSVSQAVGARSSGAFTMPRDVPVPAPNAAPIDPRPNPDRSLQHEPSHPEAATSLLVNDRGGRRTHRSRPRFARLHASIAECPMEWAWQHPPSVVIDPGERERRAGDPLNTGRFARGPWLGGVAFALLAAGVIYAVAMARSGWPPAGEVRPAAALTAAYESGADRLGPAEALVSAPADPEPSAIGTAFPAAGSAPALEIALLGPVLASAGEAEEVAAKLPMRSAAVPAAAVEARGGRVLNEPPRPIFKPTLVSAAGGDRSGARARR